MCYTKTNEEFSKKEEREVEEMKKYGFGVDVGGTTCKIGLFENTGVIVDKWEIKTNTENNGASILDDIVTAVEGKLADAGIGKDEVEGIGIGVPGPVRDDSVVCRCVNLGWGIVDVAAELSGKIGLPVKVGNDANVAALGEMWKGGGQGCKNGVMVTLGTGVGGGVIINGSIIGGVHGAGGEIGHMKVSDTETEKCGCGKCGCLEQYASATGIVRMAKKRLEADDAATTLRDLPEVTAKDIFDAAKAGDAIATELVEKLGKILGGALAVIASVIDPEMFVIGGGVSKAGDILFKYIEPSYKRCAFGPCKQAKFALAKLGNDAGIYGAAALVLK